MPKIRLDQLPLDLRKQAISGEGVVNKREVEPNAQGTFKLRTGSERQEAFDNALGVTAEGDGTFLRWTKPFIPTTGDEFTMGFTVSIGDLAEEGTYPLLVVHKDLTANDTLVRVDLRRNSGNLTFVLTAKSAAHTAVTCNIAATANTNVNIAVRRSDNLYTISDGSNTSTVNDGSGSYVGPYFVDILGTNLTSHTTKARVGGKHPVLNNLFLSTSDSSTLSTVLGDRITNPATAGTVGHWNLDGVKDIDFINADTGTGGIVGTPAPPARLNSGLFFTGLRTAGSIQHTSALDSFWQTPTSEPTHQTFGFHLEGSRGIETTARETILLDWGDLALIKIDTNNRLSFTHNGTTIVGGAQFPPSNTATYSFSAFCGKASDGKINLRCTVGADIDTAVSGSAIESAFLKFDNVKDCLIGASSTPADEKTFKGTLSKLALYHDYFDRDGGRENAEFYFDLSDTHIYDLSVNNHVIDLITNSYSESISPVYSKGGLTDADFVSVEGGVAQSASGPKNYETKIKRQLGSDLTSSRLGHHTFLTTNDHVHVANSRTNRVRTLGLPVPGRKVGVTNIGSGDLQGAYNYAYRHISKDGTGGPIRKLDPIFSDSPTKFLLGKAESRNTPLGASYLESQAFGPGYHYGVEGLQAKVGSAPSSGDTHTFEVYSKTADVMRAWYGEQGDPLNLEESVYMRGATDAGNIKSYKPGGISPSDPPEKVNANGTQWRTQNPNVHSHDLTRDWTIQSSFRLQLSQVKASQGQTEGNVDDGGARDGQAHFHPLFTGLLAIDGDVAANIGTERVKNVTFSAHLSHVRDPDDADIAGGEVDRYGNGNGVDCWTDQNRYGQKGFPRLVIQRSNSKTVRTEDWTSGYHGSTHPIQNFYPLTFSNDRFKADGSTPFWKEGDLYTLVCIKRGNTLTTKIHNGTDDVWTTLTSYRMRSDATASTSANTDHDNWRPLDDGTNAYNSYTTNNFFEGWDPVDSYGFAFGTASRTVAWPCGLANNISTSGEHESRYLDLVSIFGLTVARPFVPGLGEGSEHYHFRFWNTAKSEQQIERHATKRFAAKEVGDPLHWDIGVDFCPVLPLNVSSENVISDVVAGIPFEAGEHSQTGLNTEGGIANFPSNTGTCVHHQTRKACMVTLRQSDAKTRGRPREIPILTLDEEYANQFGSGISLFYSEIGNGSLILRAGGNHKTNSSSVGVDETDEGSYMISMREWNEHLTSPAFATNVATLRAQGFNIADWDNFNWFTFDVQYATATSSSLADKMALTVGALAVNGEVIFNNAIGGRDETAIVGRFTSDDWIVIGNTGYQANTHTFGRRFSEDVHIGEFRMWKTGKGPQNLASNPSGFEYLGGRVEKAQHANMHHYYKFQPADDTTLKNYGSESVATEINSATEVIDAQTGLPFEDTSSADIGYIDIYRTVGIPVTEFTRYTENDRQAALEIAKNSPLFFAARIPVTAPYYIDSMADGLLAQMLNENEGHVPNNIVSSFVWNDRLVLIDDENRMWPAEPGNLGWESYPAPVRVPNALGPALAGINIQGERNQAMVLIAGRSWATLLTGEPENPTAHLLGSGCGVESQRCIAAFSGIGFMYNGTLWAVQQGQAVDFGGPVQGLLPTPANTRLATSAKLSSLFVIDVTNGDCLRFHFPSQQWSVEERGATSVGDLDSGEDAWSMLRGSWAKGNTSVYGDDVQDDTPSTNTGALNTTSKVFTSTGDQSSKIHTNMRVSIIQTSDTTKAVDTFITAVSGTSITVNSVTGIDAATDTACTMYFGTGTTGAILDTGPMDTGDNSSVSPNLLVDTPTGSGWEFAAYATKYPGIRTTVPTNLSYTSMSSTSGLRGTAVRGRFQRVVLRNRKREQGELPLIEIEVK